MLTVDKFEEWLMVFRYTGTVIYAGIPWTVNDNDVTEFIRRCKDHPQGMQQLLNQGNCEEGRQAMAYLKYLEQAGQMYSAYF